MSMLSDDDDPRKSTLEVASDKLNDLSERLKSAVADYAASLRKASRFARGSLIVVGAGLGAAGQLIPQTTWAYGPTVGLIGVCLALAGGIWALVVDESAPDLLVLAHQAIEEAKNAKLQFESQGKFAEWKEAERDATIDDLLDESTRIGNLYATNRLLSEVIENELLVVGKEIGPIVATMLELSTRGIAELMNWNGGEYWTLSIYAAHQAGASPEAIVHIAGLSAERKFEASAHREWLRGEGVAGHCYQTGRELVIRDAQNPVESGWLYVPENKQRDYDEKQYRSYAAVPIKTPRGVWGVVVATSDQVGKFSIDREGKGNEEVEPVRMLAAQIAIVAVMDYLRSNHGGIDDRSKPRVES